MNSSVDSFIEKAESWKEEMVFFRQILLEFNFQEDFKWKHPTYTLNGKNVVTIQNFKDYVALLFWKGALFQDEKNRLVQPTKNVQAERQLRFTSLKEIEKRVAEITVCIEEAIEIEKKGLKVQMKDVDQYPVPLELKEKFTSSLDFERAFEALTPGRRKGYLLHFAQAKQSATRINRIEKFRERIMQGKGMQDCICGKSKRMPACDGSHKF